MEGLIFSIGNKERTIDAIEMLLELECRNIWVWVDNISNYLDDWEDNIHFYSTNDEIKSIGDCLRILYTRNESRDNLYVIGDVEKLPLKLSLHKNYSKKYVANFLFSSGEIPFSLSKGCIENYGVDECASSKLGYCLDIGFCNPIIMSLFVDNFDCDTFHQLLLANPIGVSFSCKLDKRIQTNNILKEINNVSKDSDFMTELKEMLAEGQESKLELNSLRLAYGKMFSDFINDLETLSRHDLVKMFEKPLKENL